MSGRILVVDDLAINRIILKAKLGNACYETLLAASGQEALERARREKPDLILLDQMMPGMDGVETCRRLRADPATMHVPVIMITASVEQSCRIEALESGVDDFLCKPLDEMILLARIRSLLRAAQIEAELRRQLHSCGVPAMAEAPAGFAGVARFALIGPTREVAAHWHRRLSQLSQDCQFDVLTLAEALGLSDGPGVPEAFIIAADPGAPGAGLHLLSELRSRAATRHASLCVILHEGAKDEAAMALDLGASDLLITPLDPSETLLRLRLQIARKRRADTLRRYLEQGLNLATIDPLTGLHNRRAAQQRLLNMAAPETDGWQPQGAQPQGFSVLMLDLDRFKSVNDCFGHSVGDTLLVDVAHRLRDTVRPQDLVARYGGEEFLVAMPATGLAEACAMGERLCHAIESAPFAISPDKEGLRMTCSVGVAHARGGAADVLGCVRAVIDQADSALLHAKADGRNKVTVGRSAA